MEWNFGEILWTMVIFYLWFMFIWMFVNVFSDIFRRQNLSGMGKAGWVLLIVVLPFLGILLYMVSRPAPTEEEMEQMRAASQPVQMNGGRSAADEIGKLSELRTKGAISDEEFEMLKEKAIA